MEKIYKRIYIYASGNNLKFFQSNSYLYVSLDVYDCFEKKPQTFEYYCISLHFLFSFFPVRQHMITLRGCCFSFAIAIVVCSAKNGTFSLAEFSWRFSVWQEEKHENYLVHKLTDWMASNLIVLERLVRIFWVQYDVSKKKVKKIQQDKLHKSASFLIIKYYIFARKV